MRNVQTPPWSLRRCWNSRPPDLLVEQVGRSDERVREEVNQRIGGGDRDWGSDWGSVWGRGGGNGRPSLVLLSLLQLALHEIEPFAKNSQDGNDIFVALLGLCLSGPHLSGFRFEGGDTVCESLILDSLSLILEVPQHLRLQAGEGLNISHNAPMNKRPRTQDKAQVLETCCARPTTGQAGVEWNCRNGSPDFVVDFLGGTSSFGWEYHATSPALPFLPCPLPDRD